MKSKEEIRNQAIIANTVNKLLRELHKGWARDELLCHPTEAIVLCELVRSKLEFTEKLSDTEILKAYVNFSKRSKLASGISRRAHK